MFQSSPSGEAGRDIIAELKRLGYWETGQTINIQKVACVGWDGELRICWSGTILGYYSSAGWEREPLSHDMLAKQG